MSRNAIGLAFLVAVGVVLYLMSKNRDAKRLSDEENAWRAAADPRLGDNVQTALTNPLVLF